MKLNTFALAQLAVLFGDASASRMSDAQFRAEIAKLATPAEARAASIKIYNDFSSRPSSFFNDIDEAGLRTLMKYIVDNDDIAAWAGNRTNGMKSRAMAWAKKIKDSEIGTMATNKCNWLGILLDGMEKNVVKKVPTACRTAILGEIAGGYLHPSTIEAIPAEWVKDNVVAIVDAINTRIAIGVGHESTYSWFANNTFEEIVKNENEACKHIDAAILNTLSYEQLAKITPSCFADLINVSTVDFHLKVAHLKTDILSLFNANLHVKVLKKLSAAQVTNFGKNLDGEDMVCGDTDLSALSSAAAEAISAKCLAGYVNAGKELKGKWRKIPTRILESMKPAELELMKNMAVADMTMLKTDQLQVFFNKEDNVEFIPDDESADMKLTEATIKPLKVTAKVFKKVIERLPRIAAMLLTHVGEIPDDILSLVDSIEIDSLKMKYRKDEVEGWNVLRLSKNRANFGKIIQNMGSETTDHPCSELNEEEYSKLEFLQANMTEKCRAVISFDLDIKTLAKYPELNNDPDFWKTVVKEFKTADYRDMTKGMAAILFAKEEFCKHVADNKEIFDVLSTDAMSQINGKGAHIMAAHINANNAKSLGDRAFDKFTGEEMKDIALSEIRPEQVTYVSAEVEDNYFKKAESTVIMALDEPRFTAISSLSWSVMPVEIYQGMTDVKVKVIPAANMDRMTTEQVTAFTEDVIVAFSVEQIANVGRANEKFSLSALEKFSAKMAAPQQEALKARQAAASKNVTSEKEEGETSYAMWYVIGGIVVVIIVGGVVFFCMRK